MAIVTFQHYPKLEMSFESLCEEELSLGAELVITTGFSTMTKEEDIMRELFYTDEAPEEMKENLYNLETIDEAPKVSSLAKSSFVKDKLLFSGANLNPRSREEVLEEILWLESIVPRTENVLVAGGIVFFLLYNAPFGDIDLFLFGLAEEEANYKLQEILSLVEYTSIVRTENAVTLHNEKTGIRVQVILRLYQTLSEVLHGFDVDSCCLGYYEGQIYSTKRCLESLKFGMNVVNFERLSPSYEYRLAKYATKGMSVYVPSYDRKKVDAKLLEQHIAKRGRINKKYVAGLSVLLFFNAKFEKNHSVESSLRIVSDYDYTKKKYGCSIKDITGVETSLRISNIFVGRKVMYIKAGKEDTVNVLSFPYSEQLLEFERLNETKIEWGVPTSLTWKITNPGEQLTGTFHSIVLENRDRWYNGVYYY